MGLRGRGEGRVAGNRLEWRSTVREGTLKGWGRTVMGLKGGEGPVYKMSPQRYITFLFILLSYAKIPLNT